MFWVFLGCITDDPTTALATVTGSVMDGGGVVYNMVSGIAFEHLDGRIHIALSSWSPVECDVAAWPDSADGAWAILEFEAELNSVGVENAELSLVSGNFERMQAASVTDVVEDLAKGEAPLSADGEQRGTVRYTVPWCGVQQGSFSTGL